MALRREFGKRLRVIGLLNGDAEKALPGIRQAGIDWPQAEARGAEPWRSPLGFGLATCWFVLDRGPVIRAVTGRARTAGEYPRQAEERRE
ncbi:MAG: hypothetical protein Fur0037_01490 [Planctomycetota bacterium]